MKGADWSMVNGVDRMAANIERRGVNGGIRQLAIKIPNMHTPTDLVLPSHRGEGDDYEWGKVYGC